MCLHHGDRMPPDCGVGKLWRECSVEYFDALRERRRGAGSRSKLAFLHGWLDAGSSSASSRRVDAVVGGEPGHPRRLPTARAARRGRAASTSSTRSRRSAVPPSRPRSAPPRRRLGLDGKRVVLYVGKLSPGKGSADLVAAARRVAAVAARRAASSSSAKASSRRRRAVHPAPRPAAATRTCWRSTRMADVVVVPSVIPDALSRVDPRGHGGRPSRHRHPRGRHAGAGARTARRGCSCERNDPEGAGQPRSLSLLGDAALRARARRRGPAPPRVARGRGRQPRPAARRLRGGDAVSATAGRPAPVASQGRRSDARAHARSPDGWLRPPWERDRRASPDGAGVAPDRGLSPALCARLRARVVRELSARDARGVHRRRRARAPRCASSLPRAPARGSCGALDDAARVIAASSRRCAVLRVVPGDGGHPRADRARRAGARPS